MLFELCALVGSQVFHAGTATNERGELVSSGGRVLGVTALGADVAEAQRKAYEVLPTLSRTQLVCPYV